MVCQKVRENLSLYFDKVLAVEEMKAIQEHLLNCPNCEQEYMQMQITMETLRTLPEISAPPEFRGHLMNKLREMENIPAHKVPSFNRILSLVSAAAVLVFAVGITWNMSQDQRPPELESASRASNQLQPPIGGGNQVQASGADTKEALENNVTEQDITPTTEESQSGLKNKRMFVANNEAENGLAKQGKNLISSRGTDLTLVQEGAYGTKAAKSKPETPQVATTTPEAGTTDDKDLADKQGIMADSGTRMVAKAGSLSIKVTDIASAQSQIIQMVEQSGGYVENATLGIEEAARKIDSQAQSGPRIIVRVPVEAFSQVFELVQSCGEVVIRDLSGQDITAQHQTTTERIAKLQAEENRLLVSLEQTKDVGQKAVLATTLQDVRQKLEASRGELRRIIDSAQMSTINIVLVKVPDNLP